MTSRPRPPSRTSSQASDDMSKYSLNLDALPGGASNLDDSLLPDEDPRHDHFDVVRTDEIDGPTDFTQNMEYWMRLKVPNVTKPTTLQGKGKQDLEEYISSDGEISMSGSDTPQMVAASVDAQQQRQQVQQRSAGIVGTIKREVLSASTQHLDDEADMDDSIPGFDGPTEDVNQPHTLRRTPRLQAFVEDQDDSPARPRGILATSSAAIGDTLRHSLYGQYVHTKNTIEEEKAATESAVVQSLENALQSLRQELDDLKQQAQLDLERLQAEWKAKLQEERDSAKAKLEELAADLFALDNTLKGKSADYDAQKSIADMLTSKHDSLLEQFLNFKTSYQQLTERTSSKEKRLQEELVQRTDEAKFALQQKNKLTAELKLSVEKVADLERRASSNMSDTSSHDNDNDQVSHLEGELSKSQKLVMDQNMHILELERQVFEHSSALKESETKQNSLAATVTGVRQNHTEEVTNIRRASESQVSGLNEQLQLLERQVNSANQTISSLRRDLETSAEVARICKEELTDERRNTQSLREQYQQAEVLETRAVNAESQVQILNADLYKLRLEHDDHNDRVKNGHILHTNKIRKTAEDAVRKASQLVQKQKREIETLRAELDKATSNTAELEDLRNELQIVNDRTEDMQKERDILRVEASERAPALQASRIDAIRAHKEAAALRKELSKVTNDYKIINDAVDKRLAELQRKRDMQWKTRIEMLIKDIEVRGKLLMLEWGHNECGKGDPQGYKYKYQKMSQELVRDIRKNMA